MTRVLASLPSKATYSRPNRQRAPPVDHFAASNIIPQNEIERLALARDAWRAGEIDVWELNERIHKYHNGAAEELYKQYNVRWTDLVVALALQRGVLRQEEVPPEVWPYLQRQLSFLRIAGRPRAGRARPDSGERALVNDERRATCRAAT